MLGEQGIIAKEEADKIVATLKILLEEIEAGKVEFTKDSEDIHMNMEVLLTERIGATGKRLHTARSRNDQVAVDFRLYARPRPTWMPSCPATPTCSGPSPSPSPTR